MSHFSACNKHCEITGTLLETPISMHNMLISYACGGYVAGEKVAFSYFVLLFCAHDSRLKTSCSKMHYLS